MVYKVNVPSVTLGFLPLWPTLQDSCLSRLELPMSCTALASIGGLLDLVTFHVETHMAFGQIGQAYGHLHRLVRDGLG